MNNIASVYMERRRALGMQALFWIWVPLALASLLPVTALLQGAFPFFTVVWLAAPLLAVLRSRDPGGAGFRVVPGKTFLGVTAINTGALLLVTLLVEPWSHTYGLLVAKALSSNPVDTTFGWLVRYPGLPGWIGMILFSGLVTIFAEELFFRGWLQQGLARRMPPGLAILLQAFLFTLPQAIAALLLPPAQGALYALAYSFLAVGLVGGWAAWKTGSIWPSLISATLFNLVLTYLTL